ncbi:MAG: stage II sporulation protein M [Nanoarchaeota archaeon]
MVLEQLYAVDFLRRKPGFAFVLGFSYAVIGIAFALFIFPESPSLVAVAITTILLMPTLFKLISKEELEESGESHLNFGRLYHDNWHLIKVYLFIMMGTELAFTLFSLMFHPAAVSHIFRAQIAIQKGYAGGLYFSTPLFFDILLNNLKIFVICFLISILLGNGSIFLLVWNSSVWGTIFGDLARTAATIAGKNPFIYYTLIFISTLPHGILEILAYVMATIAGSMISQTIYKEQAFSDKMSIVLIYNLTLFWVGLMLLVLGALVETYVLGNLEVYRMIILQSYGGG